MYIFVFKYLNTLFAVIPRERVRKIFRRLFTELLLREARAPIRTRIPSTSFDSIPVPATWKLAACFPSFSSFSSLSLSKRRFHRVRDIFPELFRIVTVFLSGDKTTERKVSVYQGPIQRRSEKRKRKRSSEVRVLEWHEVSSTYRRLLLRLYAIVHCSANNKVD